MTPTELFQANQRLVSWAMTRYAPRVKCPHLRDDLRSACMVRLWRACALYDPARGRFSGYAAPALRHAIWRVLSRHKRDRLQRLAADVVDPRSLPALHHGRDVLSALAQVPSGDREVITSVFLDGISQPQVAARLNVSKQRVHQRMTRGLERLRQVLA